MGAYRKVNKEIIFSRELWGILISAGIIISGVAGMAYAVSKQLLNTIPAINVFLIITIATSLGVFFSLAVGAKDELRSTLIVSGTVFLAMLLTCILTVRSFSSGLILRLVSVITGGIIGYCLHRKVHTKKKQKYRYR